jgi:hypothetical protein
VASWIERIVHAGTGGLGSIISGEDGGTVGTKQFWWSFEVTLIIGDGDVLGVETGLENRLGEVLV